MTDYTREIETPVGGHKVVIKTMITGAEREQIELAEVKYVKTEVGKDPSVTDIGKLYNAKKHETLRVFVLSIDGDVVNCFERLLKMYEPDYAFVINQIEEEQKKIQALISPV